MAIGTKLLKWQLFWLSFLILFLEIMALRWMGMEFTTVRIFPNIVIMVILIAMSAGLTAIDSKLADTIMVKSKYPFYLAVAFLFVCLIAAPQLHINEHSFSLNGNWPLLIQSIVFFLITMAALYVIFVKLGNALAPLFNALPPLTAYAINLAGSIFGVITFAAISFLSAPPLVWILVGGLAVFALRQKKLNLILAALLACATFAFNHTSHWSPYSKLDTILMEPKDKNDYAKGSYFLNSNNGFFQHGVHVMTGPDIEKYLASTLGISPIWQKLIGYYFYMIQLPYLCAPSHDNVLILGSGSGNDIACALANHAKHIDAVEIDPVISRLGRLKHPDHPYLDPRVTLYNEDARTFLRYTKNKYDLVVFGFVDPGCTIRSSSFLRVDHYVYTVESVQSVLKCLKPNGLAAILYSPDVQEHITARLYNTIKQASGTDPLTYSNDKGYTIFFWTRNIQR